MKEKTLSGKDHNGRVLEILQDIVKDMEFVLSNGKHAGIYVTSVEKQISIVKHILAKYE